MTRSKRKIKAKPFMRDLRTGMDDKELMEKYAVSKSQLRKVFQRLVDAGAIDERELFRRTSLSDNISTKHFAEAQWAVRKFDDLDEITLPGDLETPRPFGETSTDVRVIAWDTELIQKTFQRSIDTVAIDETKMYTRKSLSDSSITKAFEETQRAIRELDNLEENSPPLGVTTPRIKIKVKQILSDIRARASDFELMSKYGLSAEQLDKTLERLVKDGILRPAELGEITLPRDVDTPRPFGETSTDVRVIAWDTELIQKALQRSIDTVAIGETKMHTRKSLSDSSITKAFVETQRAVRDLANLEENSPPLGVTTPGIKIKAKQVLSDIRARASDFELMSKYGLSAEQLDKTLERLVKDGILRPAELGERGVFFDDPTNRSRTRRCPRTYLWRPLTIEDLKDPSNRGLVTDLSVMGFRTRRIETGISEEKAFAIHVQEFVGGRTIDLSAVCKWYYREGIDRNTWVAGFQIIRVSDDDLNGIRRLIALFGSKDSDFARANE